MPTLPNYIKFTVGSFEEDHEDVLVRFEPEHGPDLTYKRTANPSAIWSFDQILSDANKNAFMDFFYDEANGGSALIDCPHPTRAGVTIQAKFMGAPKARAAGPNYSRVQFQMKTQPLGTGER